MKLRSNELIGSDYNPTEIQASLKIDGIKYLGIRFEATWNTSNGEPKNLTLRLFLKPFTFRGDF